jgi:hypothetical protein
MAFFPGGRSEARLYEKAGEESKMRVRKSCRWIRGFMVRRMFALGKCIFARS